MTNPGRGDAQEEGFRGLGDIPPQEAESRACRGPRLGEAWVTWVRTSEGHRLAWVEMGELG
jgi:hypothetical protein